MPTPKPSFPQTDTGSTGGALLYNSIRLPARWPPQTGKLTGEPMPVPYLETPPDVIPIRVGRQLFVDDFLIEETDLRRTFHTVDYHPANPILVPDRPWEQGKKPTAMVFSDGVWYDPQDELYKMWYIGPDNGITCYAISRDGIAWEKPLLDVEPGTNIVLRAPRDSTTVWLDHEEADPHKRYKLFRAHAVQKDWRVSLHTSPDGIHWSDAVEHSGPSWDRTTVFWNPFRRVWVYGVRGHEWSRGTNYRLRLYHEGPDLASASRWQVSSDRLAEGEWAVGEPVIWVGADRLDPRHPDLRFRHTEPELYNLDVVAYESLLLGLFSIWRGPSNEDCHRLGMEKRNEVFIGYSRDGFHWHRPDRRPFLAVNDVEVAWNRGNVQSAGGVCLIVGDVLHFYFSGRSYGSAIVGQDSTGLARLRRDGFASMDADAAGGTLVTRPVEIDGPFLFVNADCAAGEMRVEALDAEGHVLPGFGRELSLPVQIDSACHRLQWQGTSDLSNIAPGPIRLRFHLNNARLYAFWASRSLSGASQGYVAAGGPGLLGPTDTVGCSPTQ